MSVTPDQIFRTSTLGKRSVTGTRYWCLHSLVSPYDTRLLVTWSDQKEGSVSGGRGYGTGSSLFRTNQINKILV